MNTNGAEDIIKILLVEDSAADVRLTKEVFKEGKVKNKLFVVNNGAEAIEYLFNQGKYKNAPRPDLILLDLNLPKKNGKEVLQEIKGNPETASIPVVILTTSKDEQDVQETYDLYANCYITKPFDLDQFIAVAKTIENFWFSLVKLPGNKDKS